MSGDERGAPDGLSAYDREHVGTIIRGTGTWFSARLLRLIAQADCGNLERLRRGFPDHVAAYERWRDGREP